MTSVSVVLLLLLLAPAQAADKPKPIPEPPKDAPAAVRGGANAVLSAIPSDAALVVAVRDIDALDAKLKTLNGHLGLPGVRPLLLLRGQIRIVEGVEERGSAAVVVMPAADPGSVANSMVMLLPTSDRQALLRHIEPRPVVDGVTPVTLLGRESFATSAGAFTVFGADVATVKAVAGSNAGLDSRIAAHPRSRFLANDLSIWINVASLKSSPAARSFSTGLERLWGGDLSMLDGWRSLQASFRVEPEGVTVELYGQCTAPRKASQRPLEVGSLLRGLPNEPYVLAMGLRNAPDGSRLAAMAHLMLLSGSAHGVIDPSRVADLTTVLIRTCAHVAEVAVSVAAIPEGPDGLIGVTKIIRVEGDAGALLGEIEALVGVLHSGPFIDPRANRAAEQVAYRRAAERLADVSVDHLTLDTAEFETVDDAALRRIVGKEGLLMRLGVVDNRYLVATLGGGRTRFEQAVVTVRAGTAPLASSPSVRAAAEHMPANRFSEGYVAVDRLAKLVADVARALDVRSPLGAARADLPPVHWASYTVGADEVQTNIFVPLKVIVAVKDELVRRFAARTSLGKPRAPGN